VNSIRELEQIRLMSLNQAFLSKQLTNNTDLRSTFRPSVMYQVSKRSLDICGALIGLLILTLLLPVLAVCILCEDRGTIFYKQVRVGIYGHPFIVYKLRSMVVSADTWLQQNPELATAWQQQGKLRHDPRITRIGKFLRRSSLDELPQMFNVLRGEMSLVGPRAIQFSEQDAFGDFYTLRQMVKPGLTGLWQVCGRSQTDYEQRCLLDCHYAMTCSFKFDMQILFKTIPTIVHGHGAY
jgi:exopolysaccharide production protein ExoY